MKIGFIGLGNVGGKLAGSLIRNNFDVTVREIDESLTNEFKKLGAKVAKSPKELAEQTDLIITSLPSPEVSAKVMESEDGILNGLSENKIWLEMSTTDENYIHKWPKHPYDYLVEIIKERKWDKLNIGVEMDAHYFTAFCYEKIKQGLPNAQIKDSDRLVNWARLVKSDAEIGFMKSAAKISEKGMKTAMEVIKPGVRQCDAVGEIQKTLFYGTEEFGGEYSSIATLLPTGKGTSASHLTATQEKFVDGEATIIELSGVYKRYHAPMARTILLGKPNQLKIDTMNKTIEALNAGISQIKPGNTADDVAQAFWKILDKYGIEKKSRTGYSIGIGYPPDWGEHTLNIYKGDMTILEPNVCFHMIAVMQFGDWGVEASEAIRVTENGSELFCNFPKELHIKS